MAQKARPVMTGYVTVWPTLLTPVGRNREIGWEGLFREFSDRVQFKHDLHPGWSPAVFEGDKRSLGGVQRVFAVVLDVDGGWNMDEAIKAFGDCYGFVHTSKSHTLDVHRFRVILPTSRPMSAFEYSAIWRRLAARHPNRFDHQAKDASRFWYLPGVVGSNQYRTEHLTGEPLDVDALLAIPEPEKPRVAPDRLDRTGNAELASDHVARLPAAISGSQGHAACWNAALFLRKGYALSEADAMHILLHEYNPRCQPPWTERELLHKVQGAAASNAETGFMLKGRPTGVDDLPPLPPIPTAEQMREPGDDSDEEEPPAAWERYGARRVKDTFQDVYNAVTATEKVEALGALHPALNDTMGGFRRGFVCVLGAVTNWGKTSYALAVIDEALRAGKRPLFISCEDVEVVCGKRLIARRTGINATALRDGDLTEEDRGRLMDATGRAEDVPWFLDCIGKPAEYIAAAILAMCAEWQHDLVVVDYLQKVHTKAQDRRNEVSIACDLIGNAIKRGNAAGLVLSQIKRLEKGTEPGKHDLKESGDVENAAEVVMIGFMMKGERAIKVDKNKDGPQMTHAATLRFDEETASFQKVGL